MFASLLGAGVARLLCTLLIFVLVLNKSVVDSQGLPTQPADFALRPVGLSPFLAHSFRQVDCAGQQFAADVGNLPLNRSLSSSFCPTRIASGNTFSNSFLGVSINNTVDRNAVRSLDISSAFDIVSVDPITGTKALSIEIWFSLDSNPETNVEHTLVEIGVDAVGDDGFSESENQLRVTYKKGSTDGNSAINFLFNYREPPNVMDTQGGLQMSATSDFGTALASVRTSPLGTVFLLVVSAAGDGTISASIGKFGDTTVGTKSLSQGSIIRRFVFPSTSRLRVGSTRSTVAKGFPGSVHFLAFYNKSLSVPEIQGLLTAKLPNSLPVVRTGPTVHLVNQDTNSSFSPLSPNVTVFDANFDPITSIVIRSLPSQGRLFYNGVPILNLPHSTAIPVGSIANLKYIQTDPYKFSINANSAGCLASKPFDSFEFAASDGLCLNSETPADFKCNSPVPAKINLCVRDVQDLPYGSPTTIQGLRVNRDQLFELVAIDHDDVLRGLSDNETSTFAMRAADGKIRANGAIYFNQTNLNYGILTKDCSSSSPLAVGNPISFTGESSFTLCYRAKPDPTGQVVDVVVDTAEFWFRDGANQEGPRAIVRFEVSNAIDACPAAIAVPLPATRCASTGTESSATKTNMIPIYLTAEDALGRELTLRALSLPAHGSLFLNTGVGSVLARGDQITLATVIPRMTDSVRPNVIYVGFPQYFNKIVYQSQPAGTFTNKENKTFNGCIDAGQDCTCTNPSGNCPDQFDFKAVVASDPTISSRPATYRVSVTSIPTAVKAVVPDAIEYAVGSAFQFTGASRIALSDPDDDAYLIGVTLVPDNSPSSVMGWKDKYSLYGKPGFVLQENSNCEFETGCHTPLRFYTSPTKVNLIFETLYYSSPDSASANANKTLTIHLIKLKPDGSPHPDGRFDLENVPDNDRETTTLRIRISSAGSTPEAGGSDGLSIAIYASVGALGFLVLVCGINICCCIVRRSRKAAALTRQSIASRRSQANRQSGKSLHPAIADEEDLRSDDSKPQRVGICAICCVLFTPEDKEKEEIALAQQRQSIASHHSTKSVRKSQSAAAYQPPSGGDKFVNEAPSKGREMVAPSMDGQELQVADDSVFAWEKHIDRRTGDVYFFNPRTGVSQWDPPTIKVKRSGK